MQVSVIKILKSDYIAVLSLIAPIVAVILYIDAQYFGLLYQFFSRGRLTEPLDPSFFLALALITLCICIPLFILRIKKIQKHFHDGLEVMGEIVYLKLWKDRGRVEYEYEIGGKKYRSGNGVHRNNFVNSLAEGQKLPIIVSKTNYNKGFIKDLYIK